MRPYVCADARAMTSVADVLDDTGGGGKYFCGHVRMSSNAMATQNALLCYTRGLEMDCKDQAVE